MFSVNMGKNADLSVDRKVLMDEQCRKDLPDRNQANYSLGNRSINAEDPYLINKADPHFSLGSQNYADQVLQPQPLPAQNHETGGFPSALGHSNQTASPSKGILMKN
jgi:hypothetical protein